MNNSHSVPKHSQPEKISVYIVFYFIFNVRLLSKKLKKIVLVKLRKVKETMWSQKLFGA